MNEFLSKAIMLAKKAQKKGEVPIGAVIVKDNKIISTGYNKRQSTQNAINHAEVIAIKKACKKLHSWRLCDCEMYVTLEPCPMCAGAIVNARLKTVYCGAKQSNDTQHLCENILQKSNVLNHKTNLVFLNDETCSNILSSFFSEKRK